MTKYIFCLLGTLGFLGGCATCETDAIHTYAFVRASLEQRQLYTAVRYGVCKQATKDKAYREYVLPESN